MSSVDIAPYEKRAKDAEAQLETLRKRVEALEKQGGSSHSASGATGVVVRHSQTNPPLAVVIALKVLNEAKLNIKVVPKKEQEKTELTVVPSGEVLEGETSVLRYLARFAGSLYGSDAYAHTVVDAWIEYGLLNLKADSALEAVAVHINEYLQLRTLLADYKVTIADIFVWTLLKNNKNWDAFSANQKQFPHFFRWFNFLGHQFQVAAPKEEKKAEDKAGKPTVNLGAMGSFDLDLPNAKEGAVCTRFPPEPSGYMHIGHAKAALLNNYYAEKFKGKMIVRFDDTNPTKEKDEYVQAILSDLKTLGIKYSKISYTSDYFDKLLHYAEQMIKDGNAYIDNSPVEIMRKNRMDGIPSAARTQSVEENLRLWEQMKEGTEEGIKCCMRAKIDMQNPNKALRDPTLYRYVETPHHRTDTKFKIYPIYDFACPIVDSMEGVTHALRSSEYHDRNPLYYWVVDSLKLRKPFIQDFARLNFAYTLLSKRKLQWFVDNGKVSGWNDPRFPTIQGILRRGMTVDALKEFVLSLGASKAINNMEMEKLWACNKKFIDPVVPRYTAIAQDAKCTLVLKDGPTTIVTKSVPRHKKNPTLGNKVVSYFHKVLLEKEDVALMKEGEEVTLMDWGNAIIDKIVKSDSGVTLEGHLHLEGNFKTTEKKLTWLPANDDLVNVNLVEYDYLITKDKLDEEDNFLDFVNANSMFITEAHGDPNLRNLNKGESIQLERRGYFICDEISLLPNKPMVLIKIPDGHSSKAQSVIASKVPTHARDTAKKTKDAKAAPKKD